MPCIQTKVNVTLTPEKEEAIKQKFGQAITAIPGKTENWLMCTFEDGCRMYFRGEAGAPMAFVEVKVYGKAPASAFDRLTGEITGILRDELDIAPDHVYVKYEEVASWGWTAANF